MGIGGRSPIRAILHLPSPTKRGGGRGARAPPAIAAFEDRRPRTGSSMVRQENGTRQLAATLGIMPCKRRDGGVPPSSMIGACRHPPVKVACASLPCRRPCLSMPAAAVPVSAFCACLMVRHQLRDLKSRVARWTGRCRPSRSGSGENVARPWVDNGGRGLCHPWVGAGRPVDRTEGGSPDTGVWAPPLGGDTAATATGWRRGDNRG